MMAATRIGVRMAGVGSAVPDRRLTNADLEKMMDTSDEWIVQRTGIHERRIVDTTTEGTFTLARDALKNALADAKMSAVELDLVIIATCTAEMTCPSTACRVAAALGAHRAGAFDLVAACSGFVYALNVADTLVRSGRYRTVGIVGCDALSTVVDYTERSVSILFGDGGGAAVLTADDDPARGCLFQSMQADASNWEMLYMPRRQQEVPQTDADNPIRLNCLRMNGREVYKFAVKKFGEVIAEALERTGLTVDQVSQFICHQSNERIIASAKEKFGLPDEKVHINIDHFGNTSAGSVGLVLDELWRAGRVKSGDNIVFVAFGGGLTWSSSVWRV